MRTIFKSMMSFGQAGTFAATKMLMALSVFGALMSAFTLAGCSISTSISDSVSSPFKWSSDSSSGSSAEREKSYQEDVRNYTEIYARSNSDLAGFRKSLASIGEKHGITNWEADNTTYSAIGKGLAKANVLQTQVDMYIFNLSRGDTTMAAAIQKGYDRGH